MESALWSVFALLFLMQFLAPYLASKIRKRFATLGYTMESNTIFAILNISGFWREASDQNRVFKDKQISLYLSIYRAWWVGAIVAVILFLLVNE